MDRREIKDALRRSTVTDLLDDGVENGSDLKSLPRKQKYNDRESIPQPKADNFGVVANAFVPAAKANRPTVESSDKSISYSGVFIGIGFMIAGIVMLVSHHSLNIYHAAIRHNSSV